MPPAQAAAKAGQAPKRSPSKRRRRKAQKKSEKQGMAADPADKPTPADGDDVSVHEDQEMLAGEHDAGSTPGPALEARETTVAVAAVSQEASLPVDAGVGMRGVAIPELSDAYSSTSAGFLVQILTLACKKWASDEATDVRAVASVIGELHSKALKLSGGRG